jgi:hypothetical protein
MKSLRLQLAKIISPTVTQVQLEKTEPTFFPLDKFAGVATQTEWRTIVISWIKQPGNLNKYLEIAGDITMMYETATATCQMVPLSEGLWHPLFTLRPFVVSTRSSHSQLSHVTKTWLVSLTWRFS